jgi:hypothetical protein
MLFTLGLGLLLVNEAGGAVLSFVGCCLLVGHLVLTDYRVSRGRFGSNAQEASELIHFIMRHTHESGRPPGSRLSGVNVPQNQNGAATDGKIAGAAP